MEQASTILQTISHGAMILFAAHTVHQTDDERQRKRRFAVFATIILTFCIGSVLD